MTESDELAELDTTEDEFDAMMEAALPVELVSAPGAVRIDSVHGVSFTDGHLSRPAPVVQPLSSRLLTYR